MAVALVDARDQDVADVAREIEVDVRERGELLVQEAAEEELVLDRVDVRESGEVADDRGDARAAAATGREQRSRGVGAAHLRGHLARKLEQIAVKQKEARQPERADDRELLLKAALCGGARSAPGVARRQEIAAERGQPPVCRAVLGPRIAVAEVRGEVEPEPLRKAARFLDRVRMVREASRHRLRRREDVRGVPSPQGLRLVEGGAGADGHEGVLERDAIASVGVDIARGHAGNPQPLGELREVAVATAVAAGERALELDPEAIRPERAQKAPSDERRLGVELPVDPAPDRPVPRAAGQAHEAGRVALDLLERDARGRRLGRPLARPLVSLRDQPAEVPVARSVLAEQGDVEGVVEGELRSDDRAQAERFRRLRELHRAVEAVVVGDGERGVPVLRGGMRELDRMRGAVQERERRVAVELDVGHRRASGSLLEPAAGHEVPEEDSVAAVLEYDLEVAPPERPPRPPAVLNHPLLEDRLNRAAGERSRRAVVAATDRRRVWCSEPANAHEDVTRSLVGSTSTGEPAVGFNRSDAPAGSGRIRIGRRRREDRMVLLPPSWIRGLVHP